MLTSSVDASVLATVTTASPAVLPLHGSPVAPDANAAPPASPAVSPAGLPDEHELASAVSRVNKVMDSIDATLVFEVDRDTNTTVVKVVDTASKEVIRQIPAPEMLEVAKAIERMQRGLLSKIA